MRLARALIGEDPTYIVSPDDANWYSLAGTLHAGADTATVIENWGLVLDLLAAGKLLPASIDSPDLLAPVHRPSKIMAIGLNYVAHVDEAGVEAPSAPIVFAKFPSSISAPFGEIELDDRLTSQCDYEVELAVIIGRRTRSVPESEALDSVFGYAVANDVSARDHQFSDGQWDRSKSFDTFCPLGPWITTADAVPDPQALTISSSVNGDVRQEASTSQMIHSIRYLIHYVSRGMTLEPGDVILTGTPSGVGMAMNPPSFLKSGDLVTCGIESLGAITNGVVRLTAGEGLAGAEIGVVPH